MVFRQTPFARNRVTSGLSFFVIKGHFILTIPLPQQSQEMSPSGVAAMKLHCSLMSNAQQNKLKLA